ncbi:hypothetical protein EV360DRAFT_76757 [Lentinula raphanica]|nr:hypothetical protein EV360DRAFT_76757 [Lentinula raphanica]
MQCTNAQIDEYNETILDCIEGTSKLYYSTDCLRESKDLPSKFLDPTSILDYAARLLRNFSIDRGLVKNVCVRVVALGQRVITVRLIPNSNIPQSLCDDDVLIPRISFTHILHSGHTLLRQQFPLAPAYATTFNSCQGLTLDVIGVDLSHLAKRSLSLSYMKEMPRLRLSSTSMLILFERNFLRLNTSLPSSAFHLTNRLAATVGAKFPAFTLTLTL